MLACVKFQHPVSLVVRVTMVPQKINLPTEPTTEKRKRN